MKEQQTETDLKTALKFIKTRSTDVTNQTNILLVLLDLLVERLKYSLYLEGGVRAKIIDLI